MIKARPKYPTNLYGTIYIDNIQKAVVICPFTSSSCSLREKSSLPIFNKTLSVVSPVTGWKRMSYIQVFFIENFLMAKIFQPSDKITLIFILILTTNLYDKSQTKVPYELVWYYLHR
jgi:hypothetical protein